MSEWVSVTDDVKPKIEKGSGVQVLVAFLLDSGQQAIDVRWYWSSRGFDDSSITHWMPLPELPEPPEN